LGEHHHELIERLLGLDGLGEVFVLLQESVEGQTFLTELRDEAAQGGKAAQHILHPLEVSNRDHPVEGRDLFGVGLDSPLGNVAYQQHVAWHPEDAFFGIQFHPVSPEEIERHAQIVNQVIRLPNFYDYVVYVRLNGSPEVVSENVLHTSLVRSTRVSETKWHRYVAEHAEWRDEGSRELIELLHLYLVVPE
jgi:hypothetical protein